MDYEKAYKNALEKARFLRQQAAAGGNPLMANRYEQIFPELAESEDDKIRKDLVEFILYKAGHLLDEATEHRFIKYLEKQKDINCLACDEHLKGYLAGRKVTEEEQKEQKPNIELIQCSWYMEGYHDGKFGKEPKWVIKTGDGGPRYEENPKYEQNIKQKPIEPSDDEPQRHQKELYDFKAFAAKQAKEHRISFVNDFEWNNFCDELLSFFYEKHTTDGKALLHVAEKSYQIGLRDGRMEQNVEPFSCSHENGGLKAKEESK